MAGYRHAHVHQPLAEAGEVGRRIVRRVGEGQVVSTHAFIHHHDDFVDRRRSAWIPHRGLRRAQTDMEKGKHAFIFQSTSHLTTRAYKYGIAFVPKVYVEDVWYKYFEIVDVVQGAIHDFQDIVVARMR